MFFVYYHCNCAEIHSDALHWIDNIMTRLMFIDEICQCWYDFILVVGIVTTSAAGSEAARNAAHLSRFSQHAGGQQFEPATTTYPATTLHNSHVFVSRSTGAVSTVQQMTTAVSQCASNICPSLTVVTSSSTNVINSRHLPVMSSSSSTTVADVADLLFDDQLLARLPPPLIPVPDRYQPLVDIETSDLTANKIAVASDHHLNTSANKSYTVHKPGSPKTGECSVCMESEANAALYPCGHMSMCYDCAVNVQKLHCALCPICRQPIIDILRIYRT